MVLDDTLGGIEATLVSLRVDQVMGGQLGAKRYGLFLLFAAGRISILQRTSPDLQAADVIALEASSNERLCIQKFHAALQPANIRNRA